MNSYSRDPESERRIAREAALHAVTRLYAGSGIEFDSILVLADRAVVWIYGGLAAPVPKEIEEAFRQNEVPAQQITTRIEDVRYKILRNGNRYTAKTEGGVYYTFSETIARTLKKAKDELAEVTLVFQETEQGNEISEVVEDETIKGRPVTVPS